MKSSYHSLLRRDRKLCEKYSLISAKYVKAHYLHQGSIYPVLNAFRSVRASVECLRRWVKNAFLLCFVVLPLWHRSVWIKLIIVQRGKTRSAGFGSEESVKKTKRLVIVGRVIGCYIFCP